MVQQRYLCLTLFWAINFCLGGFYAWSVYSTWLSSMYSDISGTVISAASLTYIFSICAALNPLGTIIGGFLSDRFGHRPVLFLGGSLIGIGYFLMSLSTNPTLLLLGYGICIGLGTGACCIAAVSTAVKLFPEKRGFAGGSTGAFYGVGSICLPPLANYLASTLGIASALQVMGLICFSTIITCAFFARISVPTLSNKVINEEDLDWLHMLKTKRFWAMFVLFVVVTTSPLMLFSQTVSIAREQIGLAESIAVLSVSVLACSNTCARFVAGVLSDAIGRANTLFIAVLLSFFGLMSLNFATPESSWLFFVGLICVGACFGSSIGIFPSYATEQFGTSHASMNYGVLTLAFSVAGLLGPNIIQLTVQDGQYQVAYFIAIAISLLGVLAALLCKRYERK